MHNAFLSGVLLSDTFPERSTRVPAFKVSTPFERCLLSLSPTSRLAPTEHRRGSSLTLSLLL